jgi:hypothetical protein
VGNQKKVLFLAILKKTLNIMITNKLALLFVLLPILSFAQKVPAAKKVADSYAMVDKKALALPEAQAGNTQGIADYINANFTTDSDKTRAIFIWTATNIRYDIDNMFAINFYAKPEEKIDKALKTRKGICENYAAIFNDVCLKAGLNSFVITGYTKQNGFADYIPHAWCAAQVSGNWYLFDPTWGSGYVSNGKFVKKINNGYYKVPPARLIKSHMPFDPMWEFLNYPVTNQEFYEGKTAENRAKPYFSYTDSIKVYNQLSEVEQYTATARRIEGNGVKNSLIYDRLQHLKREVEVYNNNKDVAESNAKIDAYNAAIVDYNDGINNFNAFIQYRNAQFKPMRPDAEIQAMFDASYNKLITAKSKMKEIKKPDAKMAPMLVSMLRSIDDALAHADEQKEWLQKYFSKGKFGRTTMFTKYTWMGIPLN